MPPPQNWGRKFLYEFGTPNDAAGGIFCKLCVICSFVRSRAAAAGRELPASIDFDAEAAPDHQADGFAEALAKALQASRCSNSNVTIWRRTHLIERGHKLALPDSDAAEKTDEMRKWEKVMKKFVELFPPPPDPQGKDGKPVWLQPKLKEAMQAMKKQQDEQLPCTRDELAVLWVARNYQPYAIADEAMTRVIFKLIGSGISGHKGLETAMRQCALRWRHAYLSRFRGSICDLTCDSSTRLGKKFFGVVWGLWWGFGACGGARQKNTNHRLAPACRKRRLKGGRDCSRECG